MDASLNSFADAPEWNVVDEVPHKTAIGSTCHRGCRSDIEPAVHRFEFVTLAFDRPQTVFRLRQWRWPLIGPYNGFNGAARIRGWQLIHFYRDNGWLTHDNVCSVTGATGDTQFHNEDYARPWNAYPVSKRAHRLIHTRTRFPKAWGEFLAQEALPGAWVRELSPGGARVGDINCSVAHLLEHAPHPAWVDLDLSEFDSR